MSVRLNSMAVGEEGVLGQSADAVVTPPDTAPLAKQTLAYGLSGLIVPVVGIITLPIFARVFTRSEYGVLELGTALLTVALAVTDAGLTAAALRSFYDYTSDAEQERRSVLLSGFVATTLISLAVAGILIALREDLSRWVFGHPGEGRLMIVIAVSIPAINTLRYVSEVMRVRLQAFAYLATTLVAALITTTLGIVGVLALDWRVVGVFFAGLVGNLVAAGYGIGLVRHGLAGRFSWQKLQPMLRYGLPLMPAAFAAWALSLADRQPRPGRPVRDREPSRKPAADRPDGVPLRPDALPALDLLREPRAGEGGTRPGVDLPHLHPHADRARVDPFRP